MYYVPQAQNNPAQWQRLGAEKKNNFLKYK